MALVKGSMLEVVSGAVGGVEFRRWPGAVVAGKCKRRRGRDTGAAWAARARLARGAHAWAELSDAERVAWDRAAESVRVINRVGVPRPARGYELFLGQQVDTANMLFPALWDGVTATAVRAQAPRSLTLDLTAGGEQWIEAAGAYPKGFDAWQVVSVARWLRPGAPAPRSWVYCGTWDHLETAEDYAAVFLAAGVDLIQGERVAVRVTWLWAGYLPAVPVIAWATVA